MNRITNYCRLIGLAAILGVSNTAFAACDFDPDADSPPDGVSDLSGQGNFSCSDFIGSDGAPMEEVAVDFDRNGDWSMANPVPNPATGFVEDTPDQIVLFPRGNGSRCNFTYFRNNSVEGTGLEIGGNVDGGGSVACTDGVVNNEEAPPLPEPDIVITGDNCVVTLEEDSNDITGDFEVFTATNLDGTRQAICSADGTPQSQCVRGCPEFIDIDDVQAGGTGSCLANTDGTIPLTDPITGQRCTPCLTAVQAEASIPGFDTGIGEDGNDLKLCWEYNNSVDSPEHPGSYKPHKPIRSQTTETELFNACYQTTTTINFFGREIVRTITTCR